jgi:hypothetical protein
VVISAGSDDTTIPDNFALVANNTAVSRGLMVIPAPATYWAPSPASVTRPAAAYNIILPHGERVRSFAATGTFYDYTPLGQLPPPVERRVALSGKDLVEVVRES